MFDPDRIILHHSATTDSGTVSWNAIRRYHVRQLGWSDIGYHFGIEYVTDPGSPEGSYEVMVGRLLDTAGAHTAGLNSRSIGICFVGNFDAGPVPAPQWKAGVRLVRWLCRQFKIPPGRIYGHRDFAPKTCPGAYFDVDAFRAAIEG